MSTLPVILVHGIWDTRATLQPLAAYLRAQGFTVVIYEYTPNDGSVSIETLAVGLRDFLNQENISQCDIVGFSMGGIVARLYIQKYSGYEKVRKCITIATPHKGTLIGYLHWYIVGKELSPGSALLSSLAQLPPDSRVQWFSIYTSFDLMVIPAISSVIDFGENRLIVVMFHHWMIRSKRVAKYVSEFLSA